MRRTTAAIGATVLLTLAAATGAEAETIRVHDGRDTNAVQELLGVRVTNEKFVTVVMKFSSNYHARDEYPFSIFYDTQRSDNAPEFAYFSHFGRVYRINRWQARHPHEMQCFVDGRLNRQRHTIRITIGHGCLGGHSGPVRVNVSAVGKAADQSFVPDNAPGFHAWSEPVARG
jgi:hypothetical protein